MIIRNFRVHLIQVGLHCCDQGQDISPTKLNGVNNFVCDLVRVVWYVTTELD